MTKWTLPRIAVTLASRRPRSIQHIASAFFKCRSFLAVIALLAIVAATIGPSTVSPIRAATGDRLATIQFTPVPACPFDRTFGIAFDGTDLLISCDSSNQIFRIDPATGANRGAITIDIPATEGIGAMSWDTTNNRLWLVTNQVPEAKVYTAVLNKTAGTGAATLRFTNTQGGLNIVEGLAYDATDDTIYLESNNDSRIRHYRSNGAFIENLTAPGGIGSGLAIANQSTIYSLNYGPLWTLTKDNQTKNLLFTAASRQGEEDIECDNVTFAPKSALWMRNRDTYDAFAYEVPQCAQGGVAAPGPAPAPSTPTPTTTPAPTPTATPIPAPDEVCPATAPFFPETGYCIDNPQIQDYFQARGGVDTFGLPASRTFRILGFPAQVFQRHVLRVHPDGVKPMNLLDPDVLPVTTVNFATFPTHDPGLATSAPPPNTPNYSQAVLSHLQSNVPNTFEGVNVQFLQAYLDSAQEAGVSGDAAALVALEIWGFPTSRPARDPNNTSFLYQRFQRGILHSFPDPSNPGVRVTRGILLADNLKFVLTNDQALLPADLRAQVQTSRFFNQYCPANPNWVCRAAELPDTDLTRAFQTQRR